MSVHRSPRRNPIITFFGIDRLMQRCTRCCASSPETRARNAHTRRRRWGPLSAAMSQARERITFLGFLPRMRLRRWIPEAGDTRVEIF